MKGWKDGVKQGRRKEGGREEGEVKEKTLKPKTQGERSGIAVRPMAQSSPSRL